MDASLFITSREFKRVHSAGKLMASIFWDSQVDYLEQGRVINVAYYASKLRQPSQEIARKRRGILTRCVLLLQDNASTSHKLPWLLRQNMDLKSFLLPNILLIWLLLTPTEILSSWYTVWKQWRRQRGSKRVHCTLGTRNRPSILMG